MNKIRTVLALITFLALSAQVRAETLLYIETQDLVKYAHKSMMVKFKHTHRLVTSDTTINDSGELMLTPSQGACWKITEPFKRVWRFTPFGNYEVTSEGKIYDLSVNSYPKTSMFINVIKAIQYANPEYLNENFNIVVTKNSEDEIEKIFLEVKNISLKMFYQSVEIGFEGNYLKYIKLLENTGSYNLLVATDITNVADSYKVYKEFCHAR